jgi:hypothetical protein
MLKDGQTDGRSYFNRRSAGLRRRLKMIHEIQSCVRIQDPFSSVICSGKLKTLISLVGEDGGMAVSG